MENCKTISLDLQNALRAIQTNNVIKSQNLMEEVIAKIELDLQIASSAKFRALSQLELMQSMEQELYAKEHNVLKQIEATQKQLTTQKQALNKKKVTVKELKHVLSELRRKVESLEKDFAVQKKAFEKRQKKLKTLSKIPFIGAVFKVSQGFDILSTMNSITPYVEEIRTEEGRLKQKNEHVAATQSEIAILNTQIKALNSEKALSKQRIENLAVLIAQTRNKSAFFIDLELHLRKVHNQMQVLSYSAEDISDLLEYVQSTEQSITDIDSNELISFSDALDKLQTLMNRSPKETFEFAKHTALKVLSNSYQTAYLMPTINGLTYFLQSEGKEDYSWNIIATGKHNIEVSDQSSYKGAGIFSVGRYKNWLYSKHLFSNPEDLKYAIQVMLNPESIVTP
ncbi:hypothetical protein PA25_22970 [Pseudoalteromonas sp. A25]|uniref:hypothetical protein n=1 Tax=Pseudoalteromonas sp. A25 TaxID=116092 RepID=UPI0012604973|nr:hypothetical protein [Pseudoalteromonas sp. A25]BBN82312.1 hypothetical protein PA25_22970 [Pseudoalteromonas sp. A25]